MSLYSAALVGQNHECSVQTELVLYQQPTVLYTGSSFAWEKYQDSGADNLVPIEIALRIVHAIDHDERFAAYLVIPLHPERPGPQRSAILLYTWHTIAMMYR